MSLREMQWFVATIGQPTADTETSIDFEIEANGRRAIQIYGIDFSMDPQQVYPAAGGTYEAYVEAFNDGNFSKLIHAWRFCIGTSGGGVIQHTPSQIDLSHSWLAPPALLIGDQTLRMTIFTTDTGTSNVLTGKIYYKEKAISDLQAIQLRLM